MSNFVEAIQTAIFLFPIVALFFTIPYVLYQYHKFGSVNSWRTVVVYSFILYVMSAYLLVILPLPSIEYVSNIQKPAYNFIPFNFIQEIFMKTGLEISDFSTYFPTLKNAVVYEAIFNVFLTVPFGVYLHYYFKCGFLKTVFYTFCFTLFFELTQLSGLYFIYPRSYRVFDVDDLILNTFGGIIGYFLGSLFLKFLPTREEIDEKSYEKGKNVSLIRRIASFGIDFVVLFVLTFFWGYLIYKFHIAKYWLILPFIFYSFVCILFKQSLGMVFLKLKFASFFLQPVKRRNVLVYYFIFFFFYFGLTIIAFIVAYLLYHLEIISKNVFDYTLVIICALTLMIYVMSFLKRVLHMDLMYEKISKLYLKSTILDDDN